MLPALSLRMTLEDAETVRAREALSPVLQLIKQANRNTLWAKAAGTRSLLERQALALIRIGELVAERARRSEPLPTWVKPSVVKQAAAAVHFLELNGLLEPSQRLWRADQREHFHAVVREARAYPLVAKIRADEAVSRAASESGIASGYARHTANQKRDRIIREVWERRAHIAKKTERAAAVRRELLTRRQEWWWADWSSEGEAPTPSQVNKRIPCATRIIQIAMAPKISDNERR